MRKGIVLVLVLFVSASQVHPAGNSQWVWKPRREASSRRDDEGVLSGVRRGGATKKWPVDGLPRRAGRLCPPQSIGGSACDLMAEATPAALDRARTATGTHPSSLLVSLQNRLSKPAANSLPGVLRAFVSYRGYQQKEQAQSARQLLAKRKNHWNRLKQASWSEIRRFHGEAGVVIEDLKTGWRIGHQHARTFPAASLIKIPLMIACFQAVEEGKIRLDDPIPLRNSDKVSGSGILKGMPHGTVFTVERLIEAMITQSDNTATNLLIALLGFDELNRSFRRMGLTHTRLSRKMMDFSQRKRGVENFTTAEDMAFVIKKLYRRQLIRPDVSEKCIDLLKRQRIRDRIPAKLPPGTVVAHKTGLERGVCHDAGVVFTKQGDILICVLTKGKSKSGSQPAKRFIARMALHAYEYASLMEE